MPVVINGSTGITSPGGDTSAADNTINGVRVGEGGGSVVGSTALGVSALGVNTTGINTAGGYQSLFTVTTGTGNTAFGNSALKTTTANYNNAFGENALVFTTTGANNSAFGTSALQTNTTGGANTAYGNFALFSNTTASNNTAVGYQALYNSTSGNGENVAIGRGALFGVTTGYENIGIGRGAGESITTGFRNTFVGDDAGYLVTGNNNTIIGRYTGNNGGLDIRTASNHIVLSDGDGNPRAYWNASGEFGLVRSGGNTLQNILVGYAGGDSGAFNNFCAIVKQTTASVSTSATVIYSGPNRSCVVCVQGWQSANYFSDILNCSSNSVSVISSQNSTGSPAGRTYAISSFQLTLAMASGTYEIAMVSLGTSRKD